MNITAHALPLGLLLYNVFYTSFFLSFFLAPQSSWLTNCKYTYGIRGYEESSVGSLPCIKACVVYDALLGQRE